MAREPRNREKPAEARPKQRMNFLKVRIKELKEELARLQEERKSLKEQRAKEGAGAEKEDTADADSAS